MSIQNYLQIESNVITNIVVWNGDTNIWKPPTDATMLIQSTTPAMVWDYDPATKNWELTEIIGLGNIGFTWDGTVLTTNEPKPVVPVQPTTTGTQSA